MTEYRYFIRIVLITTAAKHLRRNCDFELKKGFGFCL